jgi:hypothetical protein
MKHKTTLICHLILAVILTLGLSISFQSLLAAYTAPLADPSTCVAGNPGCDAPLNTGPLLQTTNGALWLVNSAYPTNPYGLIVQNGKVGIGTPTPGAQTQINPPASTEGLRIISASNYSPLNIRNNANTTDIFRVDQNGDIRAGKTIYKDTSGNVIIQLGN